MRIKILLLITALIGFFGTNALYAQFTPGAASWALTAVSGQTFTTSGRVTAIDETLGFMGINQYTGPNASQRVRIQDNNWPANQSTELPNVYVQFAISPQSGNILHVDSFALSLCAMSTQLMKANIYYSTDPTFATRTLVPYTTGLAENVLSNVALKRVKISSLDIAVNEGQAFYVRIYPWNNNATAVATGKYLCLQNVIIAGTVEPLATASKIVWVYSPTVKFIPTGPVIGFNAKYSSLMQYYGTNSLPISGTSTNLTVGAVYPKTNSWVAEPAINDSLYLQYAIKPKFGGILDINKVKMYLGSWNSTNIKASVYYSKDATFATRTLLIKDTLLVQNAMMPLSKTLLETVATGEVFYLRIYPHNLANEGANIFVTVDSLSISGILNGATSDPPSISSVKLSYVSTSFATSGGNIPTDGGSAVTARGVCWGTTINPTISNSKTDDGTGSGSFISKLTGLTPGTFYHYRSYATNVAGTSYSADSTFTTLATIIVPTVARIAASSILVTTAQAGGNVTAWGGDTVEAKGICWNTTGNPTILDNKTINGADLGSFAGILYPLAENTTYYYKAYATNSVGTGYSDLGTFTTQITAPDITKVVAKDGSGDYLTVQAAFNGVPELYTGKYTIFVKPGIYKEKLLLSKKKVNVILKSVHPDSTILTFDDYAKIAGGTSGSYSTAIDADDFTAMNITFENTYKNDGSTSDQQAVALRTNGDRQSYYNCRITGYQDTYYAWGGSYSTRIYMKNCYISGSVDFIFGNEIVVFDSCDIHINRNKGSLTAANTDASSKFGLVFRNCTILSDEIGFDGVAISSIFLGRPWQNSPRTVFMNCVEPASLNPAAWQVWNVTPALYAEYKCSGPGSDTTLRLTTISRQLKDNEAVNYTLNNIFAKTSNAQFAYDWMPVTNLYKSQQKVTIENIPNKKYGDSKFLVSTATTSKLQAKLISSNTNVATTSGDTIFVTGAGSVEIKALQAGNFLYNADSMSYGFTVSKANLTVTADNMTRAFGEANPIFTFTYNGFVNGDDASDIVVPTAACVADLTSPKGDYAITLSGGSASNYTLALVNGVLTVTAPNGFIQKDANVTLVYPNPANGMVTISREFSSPVMARIINNAGQVVIEKNLVSDRETIDVSNLSKGLYIIKIQDSAYTLVIQ